MHSPDVKVSISKLLAAVDDMPNGQGQLSSRPSGDIQFRHPGASRDSVVARGLDPQDAAGLVAAHNALPAFVELYRATMALRVASSASGVYRSKEEIMFAISNLDTAKSRLEAVLARFTR